MPPELAPVIPQREAVPITDQPAAVQSQDRRAVAQTDRLGEQPAGARLLGPFQERLGFLGRPSPACGPVRNGRARRAQGPDDD